MGIGVAEGGTGVLEGSGVCEGSSVALGSRTGKVALGTTATWVEAGRVSWALTVCAAAVYSSDGSPGVGEVRDVRLQAARSVTVRKTRANVTNLLQCFI